MRGTREQEGRTEEAKVRTGPSKLLGPAWSCTVFHRVCICLPAHLLLGRAGNQGPGFGPQHYFLYPQTITVTLGWGSLGLWASVSTFVKQGHQSSELSSKPSVRIELLSPLPPYLLPSMQGATGPLRLWGSRARDPVSSPVSHLHVHYLFHISCL